MLGRTNTLLLANDGSSTHLLYTNQAYVYHMYACITCSLLLNFFNHHARFIILIKQQFRYNHATNQNHISLIDPPSHANFKWLLINHTLSLLKYLL